MISMAENDSFGSSLRVHRKCGQNALPTTLFRAGFLASPLICENAYLHAPHSENSNIGSEASRCLSVCIPHRQTSQQLCPTGAVDHFSPCSWFPCPAT